MAEYDKNSLPDSSSLKLNILLNNSLLEGY